MATPNSTPVQLELPLTLALSPACTPSPDSRRLTVSYEHSDAKPPRGRPCSIPPPFPYLRLKGRWLDRVGFGVGTRVNVRIEQRRLIIEPIAQQATTA